jgi:hypothetical protein
VLAIVTKFDNFVQDVLQDLEGKAEEEEAAVEQDELEETAQREADAMLTKHYTMPLLALPHPPQAVVSLSQSKPILFLPA